jgi:hypothetical protein
MSTGHPYSGLPAHAFWRRSISDLSREAVDPVTEVRFTITRKQPIVTAGSCFAQHIAQRLKARGFNYLVTEPAHPMFNPGLAQAYNFGTYSARYGNIYTARQLVQLIERVHGRFQPADDMWESEGTFVDPFRPQIQPGGFPTAAEFMLDRAQHFAAVRKAFRAMGIFVFTLGLTEAWLDSRDGSVYPLAPGVAGGSFNPAHHRFHNFTVAEVVADMREALALLRAINPRFRTILTVSPVPLAATAAARHVLVSTTYSKSVLRVACEELAQADPAICYFPSYEIVTGNHARGGYFLPDGRTVAPAAVDHVMRLFLKHFAGVQGTEAPVKAAAPQAPDHLAEMERLVQINCDEEALDRRP